MITVSDEAAAALQRGGFQRYFVIDVSVDGIRELEDIPVASCRITSDGSAMIRNQATIVLEYSDELGRSAVPEELADWFTPYATRINLSMVIKHTNLEEKILRGTFLIRKVSDPESSTVTIGDRQFTVGSRISLTLADEFRRLERERFTGPSSPTGDTGWDELGYLTGLPLARNVDDVVIPRSVPYEGDRLDAVHAIGRLLQGTPYMDPNDRVTIEPDEWGDPTEALLIGEDGTIVNLAPDDLSDEEIYNQIVVRSHDDDQVGILATSELTTGPLRYGGKFGKVPYFVSSPFVTTAADAQAYADSELPKRSTQPAVPYTATVVPDPRREVGDVVPFTDNDGTERLGRITYLELADEGLMTLNLQVARG